MAVIHVTEAEAARDLSSLLARVREGEKIHIDDTTGTVATVQSASSIHPKKSLSEAIRWAEERDLQIRLDDTFSRDLEQVVCNHEHEFLGSSWED